MDKINKYLKWASIISITIMLFIIFLQVIFRYVLHHSLTFSEELARYLFVWTVFLGSAVVAKDNGHIVVGALVQNCCLYFYYDICGNFILSRSKDDEIKFLSTLASIGAFNVMGIFSNSCCDVCDVL